MAAFWKNVGKVFAFVGKGALTAAVWASAHPEVIAIITSAAKLPPGVATGIEEGVAIVGAIEAPKQ
jgi:hypothetical protein